MALGFIVAGVGFLTVLYEAWTTATIPLNDYTFLGIGVAGIGVAIFGVGADRYWG